jgi:hypothetical protein
VPEVNSSAQASSRASVWRDTATRTARRRRVRRDDAHRPIAFAISACVLGQRDREIGLGDRELIGEIVGAQLRIDRHDRDAERVQREPVPEELRPVFQSSATQAPWP